MLNAMAVIGKTFETISGFGVISKARTSRNIITKLKKIVYELSGFNQLGLHHDDCLYESATVQEALRRLPNHVIDERNFRIIRAMNLSMTKNVLPKNEWTKYEEDKRYLTPLVKQVEREEIEKIDWNRTH